MLHKSVFPFEWHASSVLYLFMLFLCLLICDRIQSHCSAVRCINDSMLCIHRWRCQSVHRISIRHELNSTRWLMWLYSHLCICVRHSPTNAHKWFRNLSVIYYQVCVHTDFAPPQRPLNMLSALVVLCVHTAYNVDIDRKVKSNLMLINSVMSNRIYICVVCVYKMSSRCPNKWVTLEFLEYRLIE